MKKTQRQHLMLEKPVTSHDAPFHPPVSAFMKGSVIREAYAQWWEPHYSSDLSHFLDAIVPRGARCSEGRDELWAGLRGRKTVPGKTFKVRIALNYPLREKRERVYEVSNKRFGDVFGFAHDLYKEIYAEDDAAWKAETRYKEAPTVGTVVKKMLKSDKLTAKQKKDLKWRSGLVNRAAGKLVWGHEMSDLVFESMHFAFDPEAKAFFDEHEKIRRAVNVERKKRMRKDKKKGSGLLFYPNSIEVQKALGLREPRFDMKNVIGTVTFGIGS